MEAFLSRSPDESSTSKPRHIHFTRFRSVGGQGLMVTLFDCQGSQLYSVPEVLSAPMPPSKIYGLPESPNLPRRGRFRGSSSHHKIVEDGGSCRRRSVRGEGTGRKMRATWKISRNHFDKSTTPTSRRPPTVIHFPLRWDESWHPTRGTAIGGHSPAAQKKEARPQDRQ